MTLLNIESMQFVAAPKAALVSPNLLLSIFTFFEIISKALILTVLFIEFINISPIPETPPLITTNLLPNKLRAAAIASPIYSPVLSIKEYANLSPSSAAFEIISIEISDNLLSTSDVIEVIIPSYIPFIALLIIPVLEAIASKHPLFPQLYVGPFSETVI